MKKNIYIKTKIPAPGTQKIINDLSKVESRSMHGQLPIVWKKAKGFNIWDVAGNKFIDFTSTIFVANIGHSNKRLKKYLSYCLNKNLIHSYAYATKIKENYIKKLLKFCRLKNSKAFLMSSGTEATEAALKLMRLNGIKNKKRSLGIICFEGNWHGRTMGSQMMSGNLRQKEWIGSHDNNIHHLPFPYPWDISEKDAESFFLKSLNFLQKKKKISLQKDVCGFMIETFQGWGAVYYPKNYIKALYKVCKKNKIIISFDEMQSGFARTGCRFGYEHYGIEPDLICCGKGMGGGIALSGVIGKKSIMDLPEIGNMSSTNSGNPLACYAGLAVIDEILERKLEYSTLKKGLILEQKLKKIKIIYPKLIKAISGKGLIYAIIFNEHYPNIEEKLRLLCQECMKNGLLVVYTGRESVKIGPPLTITKQALNEGIEIINRSIKKCF